MIRSKFVEYAAYVTYGFSFVMFIMSLFFNKPFVFVFSVPVQVLCFGLGVSVFSGIVWFVQTRAERSRLYALFTRHKQRAIMLVLGGLFIVQVLFVSQFYQATAHDPAYIYHVSQQTLQQNAGLTYFSTYPNNLLLLFFERAIYTVSTLLPVAVDVYFILVVINIIAIDVSLYLIYKITKKIFNEKLAIYAFVLGILLLGFTPWLTGVYSDTLSLPIGLVIFYLYLQVKERKTMKSKITYGIGIGTLVYIGYLLKPSTVFVALSILLIEAFLCNYKRLMKDSKKVLVSVALGAAVFVGMIGVKLPYTYAVEHQRIVPYDSSLNFPMTHWLMLGLNEAEFRGNTTYGMWSRVDYETTFNEPTIAAKRQRNMSVITARLRAFGLRGYARHLWDKARWTLGDGTFSWGHDGVLTGVRARGGIGQTIEHFVYHGGKYHKYYAYTLQTLWLFVLFALGCVVFKMKKYQSKPFFIMTCTIFGSILFILLFEGRGRYLINNLGFMIIVAAIGIEKFVEVLSQPKMKK